MRKCRRRSGRFSSAAPSVATPPNRFKVAAFYSISNCQPGLRGVNLGNFLIKRVAERIREELPSVRTFCTLSPIPSFADWLARVQAIESSRLRPAVVQSLNEALARRRARADSAAGAAKGAGPASTASTASSPLPDAASAGGSVDASDLRALCAFYLLHTSPSEAPSDPVARFHLNNGARLERINTDADLSRKGLRQSHGLMVNYLYDLDEIESNHEHFIAGQVAASRAVRASM